MAKYQLLSPVTQSVLPTPTTLTQVRVVQFKQLTVEVTNNDGSQTLSVSILRRCSDGGSFSPTGLLGLDSIGPGQTACVDIDVSGCTDVRLQGTASGAGLTARVAGMLLEGWP